MHTFGGATRAWFDRAFPGPTPVQRDGWAAIAGGEHSLLIAPTGSGKTLAAFLWCIDRLAHRPEPGPPGVRVVYVSPLKALVYDVERNLRAPLVGIAHAAARLDESVHMPTVAVRTGDTTPTERRLQARQPSEILVTTPESLYLILGSAARETLRSIETVIVDEIHALAPTKRGAHLALSLERLAALTGREPQRIGLSATARPLEVVAGFLGGDRPVSIVDARMPPTIDVVVTVPVVDMERPSLAPVPLDGEIGGSASSPAVAGHSDAERRTSVWPAIYPELLELVLAHRSTIIFVNSRGLCERLSQHLNEMAEPLGHGELVRAHHGSISHPQRREIEDALQRGDVRGLVATSSLELGIDMGAVDLVVLVESPGSVARGLQRIGRAGHSVGEVSHGRIFPKFRGDLLEAAVVAHRMMEGAIEGLKVPRNPLDVLAQQIVAMCAVETWPLDRLQALVGRAANFRTLTPELLVSVLDMLSGRFPSGDFGEVRPRIIWHRDSDQLEGRRGSRAVALMSGGTIPDRGLFGVHLGADGPRIGELDEEMVFESRAGETFMLGASTWRVEQITRDRVIVSPAPGEPGKLPFWKGEGPGRPLELGRAMGAFVRELGERIREGVDLAADWLQSDYRLDPRAARNLVRYVEDQVEATGSLPSDRAITVERFPDELGDWRVCVLSPFGARVHAPWALATEAVLAGRAGFEVQAMWTDDGIALRFADVETLPVDEILDALFPAPEDVEDLVVEQLGHSAMFASQFRENAARSLLLPRHRPGKRMPLWQQRMRAQSLLAVVRTHPSFPIVLETYRSCLQDVFDLPALVELLGAVRRREVRVDEVVTRSASPFARSLAFAYVAQYLYDGDAPLAERRAQALALDREMLRELLGHEELRELIDTATLETLESELTCTAPERRARHPDALHDLLRRLGDLDDGEIAARCDGESAVWVQALAAQRRIIRMRIAGVARWIAVEDTAIYRDGVGAVPPPGVPAVFLEVQPGPIEALMARFARTRGPFVTRTAADRFGISVDAVDAALRELATRGAVVEGGFRPGGTEREWCDAAVLERLRRRTLARLRREVEAVEASVLGRFLPAWHGIGAGRGAAPRLEEVIAQLEGLPMSFRALETSILQARIPEYRPRMLDELGAMGLVVWIGFGALGRNDGRVALYRRERARALVPVAREDAAELDPESLAGRIFSHLAARGASFQFELSLACGQPRERELRDALWDLVWAGRVTNDTFQPLRALGSTASKAPSRGRGRGRNVPTAGRWSLVEHVLGEAPSPTVQAHACAVMLLERYGIVSRDVVSAEALPGGFGRVYGVLEEMETAGKARRGYFVEGLEGAQFGLPGAVDRLRSARRAPDESAIVLLAATDPANPYGSLLPWPQTAATAGTPRRALGASVVLVDGEPVLYIDGRGKKVTTFPAVEDRVTSERAARALRTLAARARGRMLTVEMIDGEAARTSPHASMLERVGFAADHRGLTIEID